uniref:Uncharacterized protein n=1 Tax=Hanusia phi TaxID=3032 RepID=A0A7S0HDY8_9CRYP|mmetsp:Transcript_14585/g.33511  ORF Transcript_14585/g.33511 Transcript_14585/m.33511 type:complete len:472 (+) Transcript_14585:251-1666(+)
MSLELPMDLLFDNSSMQVNLKHCMPLQAPASASRSCKTKKRRLARHSTEADREKERLGKIAERERTRELLERLDPLVPLTKQPAPSSRGSLRTKRTLIDLYEDAIALLQGIRYEEMRHPQKRGKSGASHMPLSVYREGLMVSESMLWVEVLLPDTRVVQASRGLEKLFVGLNGGNMAGEKLALFMHPDDIPQLRAHVQGTGMLPGEFEARVVTIDGGRQGCFVKVRFEAAYPRAVEGRMVYMLRLETSPGRGGLGHWEGMPEVSGVYELMCDLSTSHYQTDVALSRVGAAGGFHMGMNAFGNCEMSSSVISRLMSRIGATYNILSQKASVLLERIAQVHYTLDLMSEIPVICIHVRLRLPNMLGTLKTPWSKVLRAACDGSPIEGIVRVPGSAVGFFNHRDVPGQLSVLYYKREGDAWRVFHQRLYRFGSETVTLRGEVFSSLAGDFFPYTLQFRKVEEADRTILAAAELN